MKIFICQVCGHIEFGAAPQHCPVCHVPAEKFSQNDNVFKEAEEKSREAAIKHIPAITVSQKCGLIPESTCTDIQVRIGKTLHPMEEKHSILFIDCYIDGKFISRMYLTPGVYAAGCFHIKNPGAKVTIVELCNVHGYWMSEADMA